MIGNEIQGKIVFYFTTLTQSMRKQGENDYRIFQNIQERVYPYLGKCNGLKILDIGCGRRYPNTLLFANLDNKVIGIDLDYIGYNEPFWKIYWHELKLNSFKSCIRSITQDIFGQKISYHKTISKLNNNSLKSNKYTIKRMNAEKMDFPDDHFDLALSVACFEHIVDVIKVVNELYRVLKTGGIAYISIHLFSSHSGGHQGHQLLENIPPWDHLRNKLYPAPVFLNKMRKDEYIRLFQSKFEILNIIYEIDKPYDKLLTSDILEELNEYSEDELTTKNLVIIARKPNIK